MSVLPVDAMLLHDLTQLDGGIVAKCMMPTEGEVEAAIDNIIA